LLLLALLLLRQEVLRMAHEWAAMFDSYDAFQAAHPGGFYLAQYEDLTAAQESRRLWALAGMLNALGVPRSRASNADGATATSDKTFFETAHADTGDAESDELHSVVLGYDLQKLACAFEAAKHPSIFRPSDPAGIDVGFAYSAEGVEGLVCDVWRVVGGRAAQHGYGPYGGTVCSS
jgi:hypothetical protein